MSEIARTGKQIVDAAREISPWVQDVREDLHRHPELRFEEHRTAERCAAELERIGVNVRRGVGRTGIVGTLDGGGGDGPVVAFRAEMDALAMQDMCGTPYQSENEGIAHLCGHDGHVASLLGAATVLAGVRDRLPGTVKFFFEPSEEATPPDEICGAEAMINDGALEDPNVDAVFGAHFFPDWRAGTVALKPGVVFSGNDVVRLTVRGRESHSAVPQDGIDSIYVTSQIVTATQGLMAHMDINEAISLHWTTVHGGRMSNLIASEVVLEGSFRFSDIGLRERMPAQVERLVKGICDAFGATYELDFGVRPMPAVVSSSLETSTMRQALIEGLGEAAVLDMKQPRLAADTMFHWLRRTPGVFYMVGTADDNPATQYPSHHQKFDISPETYPTAVAAIALTAHRFLEERGQERRPDDGQSE
ncbi:MAG: M20 family metallopeptidase [Chloroflexi bacterium]|nr:M20 family metallopeptidase [Chloroflexota bacterium]